MRRGGRLPIWLVRATGPSAIVLSFVAVFATRGVSLLVGEEFYALEYFAAIAGLAGGVVLLPRGVDAVPRPSFWMVASGRTARRPSNEPCDDYAFAFGVVLAIFAGVGVAAYWAVSEIFWLLQLGWTFGAIGALVWWAMGPRLVSPGPRRWVALGELKGHPTPGVRSYDLGSWTGPQTFLLHGREWGYIASVAAMHFVLAIALGDRVTDDQDIWLWVGSMAVAGAAYAAKWMRSGGWVTIDPERGELSWRRPRDNAPTRTWRFDEIEAVKPPGAAASSVRLDVGSHVLRIRVPTASAGTLAVSLRAAAESARTGALHG